MASSEPWVTLGRTYEGSLRIITDPTREVAVAAGGQGDEIAGFVIICMMGAFVGFIQTGQEARHPARGVRRGAHLPRESQRVSVCSSFNPEARRLYERLGYETVGELTDYLVQGHSEVLLRKSRGAWSEFEA